MIKNIVELSFTLSLVLNAALFIPQIIRIIKEKSAKGVSFITFIGFWFIIVCTVLHGFLRKDYLLAYGTILSLIPCGWVVILIIKHRIKGERK